VVGEEDLQDINVTTNEWLNYEAESENVNVEVEPGDILDLEEEWTGSNQESSVDSQEDAIPDEDDSEVDEELRSLRNERRNKVKKKKPIQTEEIKLGTAGIDRGFEDIGRNKAARYTGRLGGDEQYIDSSELDSDNSRDELDPDFVKGVDLPARRKSKKVRFDPDCVLAIFELGMVFESAEQFRKVVADYSCEYKIRLKLKPNDKKRVRVKCEDKECKWLLFASKIRILVILLSKIIIMSMYVLIQPRTSCVHLSLLQISSRIRLPVKYRVVKKEGTHSGYVQSQVLR